LQQLQADHGRDHEHPSVQFDGYKLAVMGSQLAYLATALGIHVSGVGLLGVSCAHRQN
jgi:Na+/H+ antiporter NhaB